MLSTITILNLFIEIFTAGALMAGSFIFARVFLEERKKTPALLSMLFAFYSVYVVGVIASQLMTNLDANLTLVYLVQRSSNSAMVLSAACALLFASHIFLPGKKWIPYPVILAAMGLCYLAITSDINIVSRAEIIEPVASFKGTSLIWNFWLLAWILMAAGYLFRARRGREQKEKNLDILCGISSALIALAQVSSFVYLNNGEGIFLLICWVLTFFVFSGMILGNIISPKDEIALQPLNFFRTRILFKLAMLFILIIVLIVEATTLATIAITRASLMNAVIRSYEQIATSVADRAAFDGQLQKSVEENSRPKKQTVFAVDMRGRIIAHPDSRKSQTKKSATQMFSVREIMAGKSGSGEFRDITGALNLVVFRAVPEIGIGVIVFEPVNQAYSEIRRVETSALIFVIIGIIVAVVIGLYFARSIEKQIGALITGTEAVRKGDLTYRIKTDSLDEIGQLAAEFNVMTGELKESQDHLIASEKLAALGTMAAGMAHEIKNPLVALRTFSQLLPVKWEDKLFRDKFQAVVPPEIDKINKIAENLLKFGRPSKPEFKPTNVNAVLEEVLDLLENQFKKNNIRVATKFAQVPDINGDPGQLSQALLNIILNAVQAMPEGGELVVKSDSGQVIQMSKIPEEGQSGVVAAGQETEQIRTPMVFIEVTDSGAGIPRDKMKNLFDPFYTTKPSGSGMGLPITLRIVEDHKGSIKVRSQEGKGTTFIIMLPTIKAG